MEKKTIYIIPDGLDHYHNTFKNIDTQSVDCVVSIESTTVYGYSVPVVCNLSLSGFSPTGASLLYQSEKIFHATFSSWIKNAEESYIIEYGKNKTIIESVIDKISQTNIPIIYDF